MRTMEHQVWQRLSQPLLIEQCETSLYVLGSVRGKWHTGRGAVAPLSLPDPIAEERDERFNGLFR